MFLGSFVFTQVFAAIREYGWLVNNEVKYSKLFIWYVVYCQMFTFWFSVSISLIELHCILLTSWNKTIFPEKHWTLTISLHCTPPHKNTDKKCGQGKLSAAVTTYFTNFLNFTKQERGEISFSAKLETNDVNDWPNDQRWSYPFLSNMSTWCKVIFF